MRWSRGMQAGRMTQRQAEIPKRSRFQPRLARRTDQIHPARPPPLPHPPSSSTPTRQDDVPVSPGLGESCRLSIAPLRLANAALLALPLHPCLSATGPCRCSPLLPDLRRPPRYVPTSKILKSVLRDTHQSMIDPSLTRISLL